MAYKLQISDQVFQDLEQLGDPASPVRSIITAVLALLFEDVNKLAAICCDYYDHVEAPEFDIKHVDSLKEYGIRRLKIFSGVNKKTGKKIPISYRILYSVSGSRKAGRATVSILGISHREYSYDKDHARTRRIIRDSITAKRHS